MNLFESHDQQPIICLKSGHVTTGHVTQPIIHVLFAVMTKLANMKSIHVYTGVIHVVQDD